MVALMHGTTNPFWPLAQDSELAGSTLLKVLDDFALNSHDASHPVSTENIGMPFTSML